MPLSAVLDSCVLFPVTLRDTLLGVATEGLFRPLWTNEILEEFVRSVGEHRGVPPENLATQVERMNLLFEDSLVRGYEHLNEQVKTRDPDDRHVLAAAIHAKADIIVTENVRDFPRDSEERYGVSIITADAFLTELWDEDAEAVSRALTAQAARYRSEPRTVHGILKALRLREFARRAKAEAWPPPNPLSDS